MKWILACFTLITAVACNNNANDSIENADSINAQRDSYADSAGLARIDQESANFLVRAYEGGLQEIAASEYAANRSSRSDVKAFAGKLAEHHRDINNEVKSIAQRYYVSLPDSMSSESKSAIEKLTKESNSGFDRAYLKMIVDDHEKAIKLYEDNKGEGSEAENAEVKMLAERQLPVLQSHLDSSKVLAKKY